MGKKHDCKLRFDDVPVETFIEGKPDSGGTNANVMDIWQYGGPLGKTRECAEAVAAILINFPVEIDTFSDLVEIETTLRDAASAARALGDASKATDLLELRRKLRNAARCQNELGPEKSSSLSERSVSRDSNTYFFHITDDVLMFFEDPDHWKKIELQHACGLYLDTGSNQDQMISFRKKALHYFLKKNYGMAEYIYRSLLDAGFEIPGTLCHLTRIMIVTNRMDEAAEFIETAWQNRTKAADYIILRILFFQITLGMLNDEDTTGKIEALNNTLGKPGIYVRWAIHPVLRYLKHKLSWNNYETLKKLYSAINNSGKRV